MTSLTQVASCHSPPALTTGWFTSFQLSVMSVAFLSLHPDIVTVAELREAAWNIFCCSRQLKTYGLSPEVIPATLPFCAEDVERLYYISITRPCVRFFAGRYSFVGRVRHDGTAYYVTVNFTVYLSDGRRHVRQGHIFASVDPFVFMPAVLLEVHCKEDIYSSLHRDGIPITQRRDYDLSLIDTIPGKGRLRPFGTLSHSYYTGVEVASLRHLASLHVSKNVHGMGDLSCLPRSVAEDVMDLVRIMEATFLVRRLSEDTGELALQRFDVTSDDYVDDWSHPVRNIHPLFPPC